MKRFLQLAGFLVILAVIALWFALGANRGWTRTSVEVRTVDEVTGIEGITYEKRFVPGVEFLGGGIMAGGLLLAISLFVTKKTTTTIKTES